MNFKIIKLTNSKNFFPFRKPKFPFGKKIAKIKMMYSSFIFEFIFFVFRNYSNFLNN